MTAPAGARWQRDPRVLWRRIGDGLVLLVPGRADCCAVSGAAGLLWELLSEPATVTDLAESLSAAAGADSATTQAQVDAALQVLAREGVLRRCGAEGAGG